jgi:DNA polymerase III subunit delta'
MSWKSIIGQNRVVGTLKRFLLQNRLPHALLFYGPEGVGKDAVAIQLAKTLNCKEAGDDSCDSCIDCEKMGSLQHPNLHLVFPMPTGKNEASDNSPIEKLSSEELSEIQSQISLKSKDAYHNIKIERANFIKISSIRDIRRKASLSVYEKGKRIFLIMNANKMTDEASNALLKTLEEPLPNTLLILTTSNKDALLSTITSRCQLVRFDLLTEDEIAEALVNRQNADIQQAKILSRLANGNYSRGIELMGPDLNLMRTMLIELLVVIVTKNTQSVSSEIDKLIKDFTRAEIEELLLLMQIWFRDANTVQNGGEKVCSVDQIDRLKKFAAKYPNLDYVRAFEALEKSLLLLKKNVYIQLIFLTLVIDLRRILMSPRT